jgi:hypothetical protein
MIVPIEPGEGKHADVAAGSRPEKGFRMIGSRRDEAARDQAVLETGAFADSNTLEDDGSSDRSARADRDAPENAVGRLEAARRLSDEDTQPIIEIPASFRKWSGARERFERRAEEIARAAEIGERLLVEDPADLLPPLVEQGLPEMLHEAGLAGGNSGQERGRQDADARVQEGAWAVDAEGRDAIPFGLKRRVVLRVPVFRDEERRGAPGSPVLGEEPRKVRDDRGVGVDYEELAAGEERRGVSQSTRGAEDSGLREKRELREIRLLMAQVVLDLVAEVMEINRHLSDSDLAEPPEMG